MYQGQGLQMNGGMGMQGFPVAPVNKPVGIFWDIENCPVPKGKSASAVIHFMRNHFIVNRLNHREFEFLIACDVTRIRADISDDVNRSGGVTLAHVSGTAKNAADEKLRESMKRFVDTHGNTSPTLILISGDIDFVNDLRAYQTRLGCSIIILHGPMCSQHFKTGWNEIYPFDTFLHMMDGAAGVSLASVPQQQQQPGPKPGKPTKAQGQGPPAHFNPATNKPFKGKGTPTAGGNNPPASFNTGNNPGQGGQGNGNKAYPNQQQGQGQGRPDKGGGNPNQGAPPFPQGPRPQGQGPRPQGPPPNGPPANNFRGPPGNKPRQNRPPGSGPGGPPPNNGLQQGQAFQGASSPHRPPGNPNKKRNPSDVASGMNSVPENGPQQNLQGPRQQGPGQGPPKEEIILMVTGLPGKMDYRILKDHLQEYAAQVSGRVKFVKNGQGFITFNKKENADKAIQLFNGIEVYEKKLGVQRTKSIPFPPLDDKHGKKSEVDHDQGFAVVDTPPSPSSSNAANTPSSFGDAFAEKFTELAVDVMKIQIAKANSNALATALTDTAATSKQQNKSKGRGKYEKDSNCVIQ